MTLSSVMRLHRTRTGVVLLSGLVVPILLHAQVPAKKISQDQGQSAHNSCIAPDQETALQKRETAMLGPAHAAHHAQMRVHQCEVQQGKRKTPAAGVVV